MSGIKGFVEFVEHSYSNEYFSLCSVHTQVIEILNHVMIGCYK